MELVSWNSTTKKSNNNKRDSVDLEDLCLIFSATLTMTLKATLFVYSLLSHLLVNAYLGTEQN